MRASWLLLAATFALARPALADGDGRAGGLYVLAINGGGDKADNFASHLAHLHQLLELLSAAGVPRDHVTVLASDGSDPAPDVAIRDPDPDDAWRLQGTQLDPILRDLTRYESTVLPGIAVRPATRAEVERAIDELRRRLHPGDTLLLYVTDHGGQDRRDPMGNSITLWGSHESLSVRKLGALLGRLPRQVRVVSLMSQCFSGGFAYLHEAREHRRLPAGHTCGYFSSTPDRPAYGCYPEVRGQKGVGHSFEFLSALARRGRFAAAHADVLLSDESPDVPLRSSDVYLAEELASAGGGPGRQGPRRAALLTELVSEALADPTLAPALRQLDRIAALYGVAKPRGLPEVETEADALFALLDTAEAAAKVWEAALGDYNQANLEAFLATRPAWRQRLDERALRRLDVKDLRALATTLLAELGRYAESDPARAAEGNRLLAGLETSDEISYRSEIRVAALLRMRFILTSAAGRVWVRRHPESRRALEALDGCEDLDLPIKSPPRMAEPATPSKLPPLAEDRQRLTAGQPGWLGIAYVPVAPSRRARSGLPAGATQVTAVAARSPAASAGFRPGDIVLGGPGQPFANRNDLRPFIVASRPGTALTLEVLRGKARLVLRPTVGEAPAKPAR